MINFRLAQKKDLANILAMYKDVCQYMKQNNVDIWNDQYPFMMVKGDIELKRFYLLEDEKAIIGCFALCQDNACKHSFKWENDHLRSCYLERLAVNPSYSKQGMGLLLVNHCIKVCQQLDYDFLRLFVVDFNHPAIALYEKIGFKKVAGIHRLEATAKLTFYEFGYEYALKKGLSC